MFFCSNTTTSRNFWWPMKRSVERHQPIEALHSHGTGFLPPCVCRNVKADERSSARCLVRRSRSHEANVTWETWASEGERERERHERHERVRAPPLSISQRQAAQAAARWALLCLFYFIFLLNEIFFEQVWSLEVVTKEKDHCLNLSFHIISFMGRMAQYCESYEGRQGKRILSNWARKKYYSWCLRSASDKSGLKLKTSSPQGFFMGFVLTSKFFLQN